MKLTEIVERIGYFRNKLNLSARELSLRIEKHDSYINKLESHTFNLPVGMLLKIIDALEITPEIFFAENYRTYSTDKELLNKIKHLPDERKNSLLKFLQE